MMRDLRPITRLRGDQGAVLLEAALVIPLLFTLLMALFDFGLLEFRQSQLSSAARDGARAGIITWQDADIGTYSGGSCPAVSLISPVTSASFKSICDAVLKRLVGSTVTSITAKCYVGSTNTVQPCTSAVVTEGLDGLQVTVTMLYKPTTPVGQTFLGTSKTYTASARMVIQ